MTRLLPASLLLLAACSAGSNGPESFDAPDASSTGSPDAGAAAPPTATFEGTVDGETLGIRSSALYYAHIGSAPEAMPYLVLAEAIDTCADLRANAQRANGKRLEFKLWHKTDGSFDAPVAGTYELTGTVSPIEESGTGGALFFANLARENATCDMLDLIPAREGSLTLAEVRADGSVRGSYDLTFDDGQVTGIFDVPFCDTSGVDNLGQSECR